MVIMCGQVKNCYKRGTQKGKYLKNCSSGVAMRSCDDVFLNWAAFTRKCLCRYVRVLSK